VNWEPTDLLFGVGIHASAHGVRDQLCSQAYAKDSLAPRDRLFDEAFFVVKPWVDGFVVHAHRTAHDDEEVNLVHRRQRVFPKEPRARDSSTSRLQPRPDASESFARNMLKVMRPHRSISEQQESWLWVNSPS